MTGTGSVTHGHMVGTHVLSKIGPITWSTGPIANPNCDEGAGEGEINLICDAGTSSFTVQYAWNYAACFEGVSSVQGNKAGSPCPTAGTYFDFDGMSFTVEA